MAFSRFFAVSFALALLIAAAGVVRADLAVGSIEVPDASTDFSGISLAVCEVFQTMEFQPVEWSETAAAFLREFPVGSVEDSLAGFAETGTEPYTGTSGPTWAQYVEYYGDSEWLKTNTLFGTEVDEIDGVKEEIVQKTSRDGLGVSLVFGFAESAIAELESIDLTTPLGRLTAPGKLSKAAKYWGAGWVVYFGFDTATDPENVPEFVVLPQRNGCSPYGTGESRSGNFGLGGDVTVVITESFAEGLEAIESLSASSTEEDIDAVITLLEEDLAAIKLQITKTYLRAAYRYATRMDSNAANSDGGNLRINQLEGLVFFRAIEPLVAGDSPDEVAFINEVFSIDAVYDDFDAYEPVGPGMLAAVSAIVAAEGIAAEDFGTLQ